MLKDSTLQVTQLAWGQWNLSVSDFRVSASALAAVGLKKTLTVFYWDGMSSMLSFRPHLRKSFFWAPSAGWVILCHFMQVWVSQLTARSSKQLILVGIPGYLTEERELWTVLAVLVVSEKNCLARWKSTSESRLLIWPKVPHSWYCEVLWVLGYNTSMCSFLPSFKA